MQGRDNVRDLVDELVSGRLNSGFIDFLRENPFSGFQLAKAVSSRPSVLQHILDIDTSFLKRVHRDVSYSKNAGLRIGKDWLPTDVSLIEEKIESDNNWSSHEDLKPLNDVCTKWCSRHYFPDAFSRVNMVLNVIRLYDQLRDSTGLKFNIVFKGGVMIRLVLLEFLNDLPLPGRVAISKYLSDHKALSLSDFDFEIVPDDHNSPSHMVHRFFLLDYAVLLWLQRSLQQEIETGKDGMLKTIPNKGESEEDLRTSLQKEIDELPSDSSLYKARIDHVFVGDTVETPPKGYATKSGGISPARRNNVFVFDCGEKKCVMKAKDLFREMKVRDVPSSSGGRFMYSTLNSYIGETPDSNSECQPEHLKSTFHLSRIKHSFVVYYRTKTGEKRCDRLSGEMVDLSQSHNVTVDMMRRKMYETIHHPYKEYPIIGVSTKKGVLRSYSVEGFLFDHMSMIHHTEEDPWKVKKKEKRISRYVSFLVAFSFSPEVEGTFEEKHAALGCLVSKTSSVRALLNDPPLNTVVGPFNRFAWREEKSVRRSPKSKEAKEYLYTVNAVLSLFFNNLGEPKRDKCNILNETHLELASGLVYNM